MPIYDYKCQGCGNELPNEWVRNRDDKVKCKKCGRAMAQKISAPNLGGFDRYGRSTK